MSKHHLSFLSLLLITVAYNCKPAAVKPLESPLQITLKWYQSYPEETKEDIEIGMLWIMSFLGAEYDETIMDKIINWNEDETFLLDLDYAGFNKEQIKVWKELLTVFKQRSKYKEEAQMDVGAFVMESFNNSWHYYALTQASTNLDSFKAQYNFDEVDDFAVAPGESCVTKGMRVFNNAKARAFDQIAHIAKEGHGETAEKFVAKEFEVFDFMSNGQPRFAVYNVSGDLITGGDPSLSEAGKPAKCMWCHTSKVQPVLFGKTDVEGYGKLDDFQAKIKQQNRWVKRHVRKNANAFIADSIKQHSLAELIYVNYQDPSIMRLRNEGIDESKLAAIEKWYKNGEYEFMDLIIDSVIHRKTLEPDFKLEGRETDYEEINLLSTQ